MVGGKKVVAVLPGFNAERTLMQTHKELEECGVCDLIILVDDGSRDNTVRIARSLTSMIVHCHDRNRGYGANQKTCYRLALEHGADIVIMVHPDYQYTPKLVPAMAHMIASGLYSCVIASRILGGCALKGGMPLWKYSANRVLTLLSNLLIGAKLSEYHTGYRAFSSDLLQRLPIENNSDDFVFDHQILAEIVWAGCVIGEVSCPTKYFPEASSINFPRSLNYGVGCVMNALEFRLAQLGLLKCRRFTQELHKAMHDISDPRS